MSEDLDFDEGTEDLKGQGGASDRVSFASISQGLEDMSVRYRVKNLNDQDFILDSKTPMACTWEDCMMVLFYNPTNVESLDLMPVWEEAARVSSATTFASVNMIRSPGIAKAIVSTIRNPDNPLHDFGPRGYPTIIVYRAGWPQGYYNGSRTVQQLVEFSTVMACDTGFHERKNNRIGMSTSTSGISGTRVFSTEDGNQGELPSDSRSFVTGNDLRGYPFQE